MTTAASTSLTRSKSLYAGERDKPDTLGYLSKDKLNKVVSAVDDDDEDDEDNVKMSTFDDPEGVSSPQEGPFSALTPSMWPSIWKEDKSKINDEFINYDEFGFRLDVEDGPEENSNKLISAPFQEHDPQKRLQWIAHLEFAHHNKRTAEENDWDAMLQSITRSDKLRKMVKEGIPHSLRPHIWMRFAGALAKKADSDLSYKQIVKASSNDHLMTSKQIEKDLLRTMPTNACFSNSKSNGIPRLRRILRGIAWLYPEIGYCQGTFTVNICL